MGGVNSKPTSSILKECKYTFQNSESHDVNWNDVSVYIIKTLREAKNAVDFLEDQKILYVDCEGNIFGNINAQIGLIQIASSIDCCFIFDVISCPDIFKVIKDLLESSTILKVFHDCSGDAAALKVANSSGRMGIHVKNVQDTQVIQKLFDDNIREYSLNELYKNLVDKPFPKINTKNFGQNKWIDRRPLSEDLVKYATVDIMVLPQIYKIQKSNYLRGMNDLKKQTLATETEKKLDYKRKGLFRNSIPVGEMYLSQQSQATTEATGMGGALAAGAVLLGAGALALFASMNNSNNRNS